MLARPSLGLSRTAILGLVVLVCLLATAGTASASTCSGRGYKVVKRAAEYKLLNKVMSTGRFADWRYEFNKPPIGVFACSNRYHRRVFLGLNGGGEDGESWAEPIVANYRYAAWVRGATNNLDGGGDYAVRLADLETGESLGSFRPSPASSFDDSDGSVRALALSEWGAVGWIEDGHVGYDSSITVWLRTSGRPRMQASDPNIDPKFLKFDWVDGGRGLIWSTGNSVTNSPAT